MPDRSAYAVDRRLDYIDALLLTQGSVRRGDLMEQFGVSLGQASHDIRDFLAAHPDAVSYDLTAKQYVPARTPYRTRRGITPPVLRALKALHATGHPMGWRLPEH